MNAVLALGSIVLYRVGGTDEEPELRPAIIVNELSSSVFNLVVLPDGQNDRDKRWSDDRALFTKDELAACSAWRTNVAPGSDIGQWRYVPQPA